MGRGFACLDTGSYQGLADASVFVITIQKRTGLAVACLEEIAYKNSWINLDKVINIGESMKQTEYGQYLLRFAKEKGSL